MFRRAKRAAGFWGFPAALALLFLCPTAHGAPNQSGDLAALRQQIEKLNEAAKFAEALPLAQKALTTSEKSFGSDHPETAKSLRDLGDIYVGMADYTKAEAPYQRATIIFEKAFGTEHPSTAESLSRLGELYMALSAFFKAEPLLQRALRIREKSLGPVNPDTAESLNSLANLYHHMGDYSKAEPLYQRALKIREDVRGPDHPEVGESLNNLATLYQHMGEYAKAEPLYQRALKIREKTRGPENPDTAESLSNLAEFYNEVGDYGKAEPLYQRALKIDETVLGPEHRYVGIDLNNLAGLYDNMGDYAKAESLYQRALKIREKTLGPENPDTATDLNNLAGIYTDMGNPVKAEPLFQRALKIYEKALGPEHPTTGVCLSNLAKAYHDMGDYPKAEALYWRALKIHEKILSPDHVLMAKGLKRLACLKIDEHNITAATELALQTAKAEQDRLASILSFTAEEQRLAFQNTVRPYDLFATLGRQMDLARTILRYKGIVLDSLLEDRLVAEASEDPKQRDVITEIRSDKQRLMKLQLEVPHDLSEKALKQREADKQELSHRVGQLEGGLARQVSGLGRARRGLSVAVAQVQAGLEKDQVLIEVIRYNHYLGKNKSEPRYGAVVIAATGQPKWVPLGDATEIEKAIALYQKSARGKTDEPTLRNALQTLYAQIWSPIGKALPNGTKRVTLSPDSQLNFVSFATLLGADDKFVGERYSISYVASGRDLLRETKASSNSTIMVYANPDFGGKTATLSLKSTVAPAVALRSVEMRDVRDLLLPQLPGTAAEAAAIEKRFRSSAKLFLSENATKAQLQRVDSPHILHLATHGFFLPEIDLGRSFDALQSAKDIPKGKLVNPMHRSGLALAGAQRTLEAWSRGEVPPTENDGIVTAEEVGGLKLDRTWLVVLSACDTGSGEARAGEGVMGLRRGFIQAGARNLLMTLWPISDQTTVQIMLDFYDAADKTHNAPLALADVQRDWLVKLRKERGLLDAVRLAGPFIMSSQGKQ
jgi:CHAT domain-containing protein/Tfp pilus assembly protein PilF